MLNDEIQAAREVTKTSNWRMQTFRTPDFGALGHADADRIAYYRRPERKHMPDTEFDVSGLAALPRVDIIYAYPGSDGTAVRAFVAAGAKGIVSAGFAPGSPPPADLDALAEAVKQGVTVGAVLTRRLRPHLPQQAPDRRRHPRRRQPQSAEGPPAARPRAHEDLGPGRNRADVLDLLEQRPHGWDRATPWRSRS